MLENIPTGYLIGAGSILAVGICFFLFFTFKSWKKHRAIKHYEEIRDQLTIREQKEEEERINYGSGLGLGNLIGGFIVILVGIMLLPVISEEVNKVTQEQNIDGASETVLGLVSLFFVLATMFAAICFAYSGLRGAGLI